MLLHEGGCQNAVPFPAPAGFMDINRCDNFGGADLRRSSNGLDPQIDVVVSGHTHQPYICTIDGRLVTSASSFGRLVTDIDLVIDHQTKDVKSATAVNRIVTQTVAKDPALTALVDRSTTRSLRRSQTVSSGGSRPTSRAPLTPNGESALGDVIADAQLEATAPTDFGGAVIAFMNPGGIRQDLLFSQISGGEAAGEVTYGELFTVQPFGNSLVVKTCTGAQIDTMLEQQFNNPAAGRPGFLQVSTGSRTPGTTPHPSARRSIRRTIKLNGVTLSPTTGYRVTMNSFLATGGDGFTVFANCTDDLGGEVDLDALARYFTEFGGPVPPGPQDRITQLG